MVAPLGWYPFVLRRCGKMGARLHWLLVLVTATCYMRYSQPDECTGPLVSVEQGVLCGRVDSTRSGLPFVAFQGIPYARPPVGDLRFLAPQPPLPWTGTRRATNEGHTCWQSGSGSVLEAISPTFRQALLLVSALPSALHVLARRSSQDEDCLHLNVYTRQLTGAPRAVMVWIHGGGFHMGSGGTDLYGPEYLVQDDVVLVTINYRLGPLGFLSAPDGGVSGNAGMKDQVAALRWVRANVARFGGDPSRVTIFGESAGGTSVQLHLLSPLSRGLFEGAISQSGSALNTRSVVPAATARARAYRLAKALGLQPRGDAELVAQLRQVPASRIVAVSESVLSPAERGRGLAVHPFVPSVESPTPTPAEQPFLPAEPVQLLAAGDIAKVPYITGVNSLEAGFMLNGGRRPHGADVDVEVENLLPNDLGLTPGSPEFQQAARRVRQHYFHDGDPSDTALAQFYSDMFVGWVVHRSVNMLSRLASMPFYVYQFSFDGNSAPSRRVVDKKLPGVNHGDELGYLFPMELLPHGREASGSIEEYTRRRFVRLWTNFAKTGNPNIEPNSLITVQWPLANNDTGLYLDVDRELSIKQGLNTERMAVWDELYTVNQGGRA